MKRIMIMLSTAFLLATGMSGCRGGESATQADSQAAIDCIMTRTSIRSYTQEPVSDEAIETMLRAGMAAPTAVNAQPWHFVVVNAPEALQALSEANPRAKMLQEAPLAIVVCGDMTKTLEGKAQEFWIQDCSAAAENILLAAHALGLGAVWTAVYPMEERIEPVRAALGLPETIIPLCTIVIGHPADHPTPKDKWKPENVSYNRF